MIDNVKPIEVKNWLPLADKEEKKEKKKKKRIATYKERIEKDDWKYEKPPLSK